VRLFVFVSVMLLVLALAFGTLGCYWGEGVTDQHGLKVTLDDVCFTDELTSSDYSAALLVTLSFENEGESALYFDYYNFVYIAGDTDLFTPGSIWCESCPPVVSGIFSITRARSLKPDQKCSCQLEFAVVDEASLRRDERFTLVVYGEDSRGDSAVVEFKLPRINDMRICTEDDLAEGT
jgi:hypothetical protein